MREKLLGALIVGILFVPFLSIAQGTEELIVRFDSTIEVRPDASITVEEKIVYDFGTNERHGIYRDIPDSFTNSKGKKQRIQISNIHVKDERGESYTFDDSKSGGDFHIKIGDADVVISGVHTYVITYDVGNAISVLDDRDELYWNSTGNKWSVPILEATTLVRLPEGVTADATSCYQGGNGSTEVCNATSVEKSPLFLSTRPLQANEGLTVAVGFKKGTVALPAYAAFLNKISPILRIVVLVLGAVGLIASMFISYTRWRRDGRDPKQRAIVTEFSVPDDLNPLEVAYLLYGRIRAKDLSAYLIWLATKGVLKIKQTQTKTLGLFTRVDYNLTSTGAAKETYGQAILDKLFSTSYGAVSDSQGTTVNLSAFKEKSGSLAPEMVAAQKEMGELLTRRHLFTENPVIHLRNFFMTGCIIAVVAGVHIYLLVDLFPVSSGGIYMSLMLLLSALCFFVFAPFMPQKTKHGGEIVDRLLGLKEYIRVAEKERISFHNAPEKNPQLFETLLPFAMVFSLEKKWASAFSGILREPPGWYSSTSTSSFNPALFAASMNSFSSTFGTSSGTAASSGGGSSGGGGGGGGGGSW